MAEPISELEARVAELAAAQERLAERVRVLEARAAGRVASVPLRSPGAARAARPDGAAVDHLPASRHLALAGATLVALAGAFVLRAITDAGVVPAVVGVALGLAYAALLLVLAARGGAAPVAVYRGLAALLVALPLLAEATTRFRLLSPAAGAAGLAVFSAAAIAVAARRRLLALAWFVELGAIATALSLAFATDRLAPALAALVLLGVVALWLGYVLDWFHLRWPIALVVDVAMLVLAARAVAPGAAEGPRTAIAVQGFFMAAYLGSIAVRTLLLRRAVVDFEVVQTAAMIAVGLGGAAFVTLRTGSGALPLGALCGIFAVASYAVAFAFVERRQRGSDNFQFYASAALVFAVASTALVLSGPALALAWASLAVVAAAAARARHRLTLAAHASLFAVLAAIHAGALSRVALTMLATPSSPWPRTPAPLPWVVVAMAAVTWLTAGVPLAPPRPHQRAPRCALLATLALSAIGLALGWLVPLFGGPGPAAGAWPLATIRTAVLVAGVLLLAWAGRRERWHEAGWLAYPLLGLAGLKLLLDDLVHSGPAALVVAFGLYGGALILVPRLRRPPPPRSGGDQSADAGGLVPDRKGRAG